MHSSEKEPGHPDYVNICSDFAASMILLVLFYILVGVVVHVGIEALFQRCCVFVSMKQYTIFIVAFSSFAMVLNWFFFR